MARNFEKSTADDLQSVSVTGLSGSTNRTFMTWIKPETISDNDHIFTLGTATTGKKWTFRNNADAPQVLRMEIQGASYTSSLSLTAGSWAFVALLLDGTTIGDHTIFLNSSTEDTTGSNTLDTSDTKFLLNIGIVAGGNEGDADYAHSVLWNTNLTDDQMSALARGVNPFCILHSNQLNNYPLNGNESDEGDYSQNQNLGVLNNTTKATTNPPVELLENCL